MREENNWIIQEASDPNFKLTKVIILGTSKRACHWRSAFSTHQKTQEHSLLSSKTWV